MSPESISSILASDVVSGFDVHKPERMNELFRKYGDQGASMFLLLRSLGFEKSVAQTEYSHNEENRIHETFKVRANVSDPTAGVAAAITLHTDSLDANNRFYPRLWDQVIFPNEVVGIITDIDVSTPADPVVTVTPNDSTDNIGALTAGDELVIFSAAFSEGSGQPEGAAKGTELYTNNTQIIKETIGMTGTEMTNQSWLRLKNMEGAPWYYENQSDVDYRMALKIDGALLFNKKTTNSITDAATGNPIRTTEGLVPYMRRKAQQLTVASGSATIANFDTIDKLMDKEGAGKYTLSMLGIDRHQEFENLLKDYFDNTNISYAKQAMNKDLFKGDESLAASVNFTTLLKSERVYAFKRMEVFNNPKLYGATGYNMSTYGMFVPLNTKPDAKDRNKKVESIGCRYKGLGQYDRRMEVWQVGGAGAGLKVTEFDKRETFMRADVGAHFRGGNQMVLMTP